MENPWQPRPTVLRVRHVVRTYNHRKDVHRGAWWCPVVLLWPYDASQSSEASYSRCDHTADVYLAVHTVFQYVRISGTVKVFLSRLIPAVSRSFASSNDAARMLPVTACSRISYMHLKRSRGQKWDQFREESAGHPRRPVGRPQDPSCACTLCPPAEENNSCRWSTMAACDRR